MHTNRTFAFLLSIIVDIVDTLLCVFVKLHLERTTERSLKRGLYL